MLIIGDKEEKVHKVAKRDRNGKDYGQIDLEEFIKDISEEIQRKGI